MAKHTRDEDAVFELVKSNAYDQHRSSLHAYLFLKLHDGDTANQAMSQLIQSARSAGCTELLAPPGARARLFFTARSIANKLGASGPNSAECGFEHPLFEKRTPNTERVRTPNSDQQIRNELIKALTELELEALLLRHVYELSATEIAHVLEQTVDSALDLLTLAGAKAKRIVGAEPILRRVFASLWTVELPGLIPTFPSVSGAALESGDVVAGRYAIVEQVGQGAFGDVFRAHDRDVPGHVVALKMLRDSARSSESEQRALRELRHLASVFHPSVVQFKDHGWHDGRLWFVMPWYEGETLEERITRAPLTRREARPIFEKLAHALGAMHAAGIRHQDIKPENVILTRIDGAEGEEELGRPDTDGLLPVLIDFGVAAREAEMVVAGTPIYFAPEVAAQFTEGEATSAVTLKADVFSLALCLRNALEPEAQEEILEGQVDDFIQRRAKGERALPQQRSLRYLNGSFQRWLSTAEEERPTAREFATELRVLTEPEEQRARRRATLRWLAPLMLCIGSMAGTGAFALHHRAEIQKREALDLRENLMRSEARERTLKKDVRSLVDEHHRSLQTRQQLASQLELKEEQLDTTRHDLHRRALESAQRRSELERSRADLLEKQKELTSISAELASREGQLQDAQSALHTIENSLAQTLTRAQALETESRALREQSDKLTKQLTSAQDETSRLRRSRDDAARAKSRAEARVQSLEGALSDARITNQRLRERIQTLERARVAAQAALRGSSRALANEHPNNDFQW